MSENTTFGMDEDGHITARAVHLVGRDGRTRAMFALDPADNPVLSLQDDVGRERVVIGLVDDGAQTGGMQAGMTFFDRNHERAASIQISGNGRGYISFYDAAGQIRATLGLDEDGQPLIALTDSDSSPVVQFGIAEDDNAFIFVKEPPLTE